MTFKLTTDWRIMAISKKKEAVLYWRDALGGLNSGRVTAIDCDARTAALQLENETGKRVISWDNLLIPDE